jgi:hypothetical protein
MRWISFVALLHCLNVQSQEIFRFDFDTSFVPENWEASSSAEWGRVIGEDHTNYFRFHPIANTAILQSSAINLNAGNYMLYFSWNETGTVNPNFININIKRNNQPWQEIADFGGSESGATGRIWIKDSVEIGNLENENLTIQFQYKSDGKFPSQYMALDNIFLIRTDQITTVSNELEKVVFSIFPNPASTNVQLQIQDEEQRIFNCNIYNAVGQIVLSKSNISNGDLTLDIAHLYKGIYLVEIQHADGNKSEQLIIQ